MVSKAATMRLLYWWLKAQLEAVRFGLISMQEAFLADIAGHLPDGREVTVLELVGDRLDAFDPAELARELPEPKEQPS
jgi:hypothetical protein